MADYGHIGLTTSFVAGAISFLSPCVLPLVPGYVSFIAGHTVKDSATRTQSRIRSFWLSACFVAGFTLVFMALGASATALGRLLLSYRYELNFVAGAVVIAFGLIAMGILRPRWFMSEFRVHPQIPGGRPVSALILGLAFGFGWTPCIGPVLGTILTLTAVSTTVSHGIAYLATYALGLGLPFLIVASSANALTATLTRLRRTGRWLQVIAGAVMMAMGVLMVTGQLSALSYWFLENIPALGRIG